MVDQPVVQISRSMLDHAKRKMHENVLIALKRIIEYKISKVGSSAAAANALHCGLRKLNIILQQVDQQLPPPRGRIIFSRDASQIESKSLADLQREIENSIVMEVLGMGSSYAIARFLTIAPSKALRIMRRIAKSR